MSLFPKAVHGLDSILDFRQKRDKVCKYNFSQL